MRRGGEGKDGGGEQVESHGDGNHALACKLQCTLRQEDEAHAGMESLVATAPAYHGMTMMIQLCAVSPRQRQDASKAVRQAVPHCGNHNETFGCPVAFVFIHNVDSTSCDGMPCVFHPFSVPSLRCDADACSLPLPLPPCR